MNIKSGLAAVFFSALLAACGGGTDVSERSTPTPLSAGKAPLAAVSATAAAEQLFAAAEAGYPSLFPGRKTTQSYAPFVFRYYPETGIYLGVVVTAGTAYTLDGVYLLGGTYSTPTFVGLVSSLITVVDPNPLPPPPSTGNKTLVVTVSLLGSSSTITVGSVPAPTNQTQFCSDLAADTTFTSIGAGYGGTMTINSCSFSGNVGSITATLTISGPFPITTTYTITYTYT